MLIIKEILHIRIISAILFILGSTGLVLMIIIDKLYFGTDLLAEGFPDFSNEKIIRSIMIFISITAIILSFIPSTRPKFSLVKQLKLPLELLSIIVVLTISVIILFLFIYHPSTFSVLSLEDGIIETGSALLLFGSCVITAISFVRSRNLSNIPTGTQLSLAILSILFFLIAMEEISWFQRVFEFDIPKEFNANLQYELNFHNFYTNTVENIYYGGAFLFLLVLPFLRLLFPYLSYNTYLKIFVGRPYIAIIGSIACAYNFDMWNIIFTQIAFYSSIIILFIFFVFSSKNHEKFIIIFTLLLITLTQVLFLNNGENFYRLWEITEYKEFFIPLAFFIYSVDVLIYMKQLTLSKNIDKNIEKVL